MDGARVRQGCHAGAHGRRRCLGWLLVAPLAGAGVIAPARADTVYLEPEQFLAEVLGQVPKPQALWLTPQIQQAIVAVLEHPYRQARVRYWRNEDTVAWILEEIGKEFPITAGFAVRNGKLIRTRVLVYRESRGGEVQQRSFVRQFDGAALLDGGRLDRRIDGITGATMSVDAMQRMARLALLLTERLPPG